MALELASVASVALVALGGSLVALGGSSVALRGGLLVAPVAFRADYGTTGGPGGGSG